MPGDTGKSRQTAADTAPPAPDAPKFNIIDVLEKEITALGSQVAADRAAIAKDPDGTSLTGHDAGQRIAAEEGQYRQLAATYANLTAAGQTSRLAPGTTGVESQFVTTIDPSGIVHYEVNKNYQGNLVAAQTAVAQANAASLTAKSTYDSVQAALDQQKLNHQISQDEWQQRTTENAQKLAQSNADADRALRAQEIGIGQQNADTSRLGVEQAGPIEAMRAAGAIGDAAVRGNLIPSMLPYMVPKGGLNNFNSALAALGAVSGAKVAPTVTAPMPPFDPTTVGGQTSANALASLTASQNTLPAVANFQAPRPTPSPVVAGASVQPVAAQPATAQPAAAPLAAPPSLEQILQSARAQVLGPLPNPYGTGNVGPPVVSATS